MWCAVNLRLAKIYRKNESLSVVAVHRIFVSTILDKKPLFAHYGGSA